MRQIKFRGICTEEFHTHHEQTEPGQWIYGYLVDRKTISHKMSEEHGGMGPGIVNAHIEVDPETVGQYTGLKDKNGTDIYEGDLLQPCSYRKLEWYIMPVSFKNGVFFLDHPLSGFKSLLESLEHGKKANTEHEVIGNIHEKGIKQ